MSGSFLTKTHNLVQKYKNLIAGSLGILTLFSLLNLCSSKYDSNIELMLPMDKGVQRSMRFLRESNYADKLVISLGLKDNQHTTEDLILATDQFAASIKSPLVNQVISSISSGNIIDELVLFLKFTPQLLGPETLLELKNQITPEGIKERLKFIYRQSIALNSSFMMPFLRSDPFGLSSGILQDIEKLSRSSGYGVVINNGHFISKDGRHSMIIIKTPVLLTEGFGSHKIVSYLKERIQNIPSFVSADIIAGHVHAVDNEDIIKRDIRLSSSIAALAFLLLFLFVFRDLRAGFVFLIPLIAVLISIAIESFVFKNQSYFAIGMGTIVTGIAIDYGIYVYIAVRRAGSSLETLKKIIRPVICGAMTTISVLVAFFFSSVQGYRQLAFFSSLSVSICLVLSLFILPHFIGQDAYSRQPVKKDKLNKPPHSRITDRMRIIFWLGVMVFMVASGSRIKFNNNIAQLDGVSKGTLKAEENFYNVWGGRNLPAVFVVSAKSLEAAYQLNAEVYEAAIKKVGQDNFTSLASIWPGALKRKANLSRWEGFWSREKEGRVKIMFANYSKAYNFAPDAFQPFFDRLRLGGDLVDEPKELIFFKRLKEQFVLKKEDGYQIVSFFPDQDKYIAEFTSLSDNYPGTFFVSQKNFSQQVTNAVTKEFIFLSLLAVFATVVITLLLLRSIKLSILAMLPVVTSLVMIIGVAPLVGLAFNISGVMVGMFIVGIVSDYGMFVVYYCKHKFQTGTYMAVTLAAVTTLIGTGVLLFAHHPMLFSIGVTMTIGVLSGYLSSLIIIPPLYRLWIPEES